jgi:hypothetical protein
MKQNRFLGWDSKLNPKNLANEVIEHNPLKKTELKSGKRTDKRLYRIKKVLLFFLLLSITPIAMSQIKITNTGNVGIGRDPAYKFEVGGVAKFSAGWLGLILGWSSDNYCPAIYSEYNNYLWIGRPDRWLNHIWCYQIDYQNITKVSDFRLKENIEKCSPLVSKLMQVRVYTYNYNDTYFRDFTPEQKQKFQKKEFGFIAQELEEIFPELVYTPDSLNDYYGIDYVSMVPILVEAIKEQQSTIEILQQEVKSLKKDLTECCNFNNSKSLEIEDDNKSNNIQPFNLYDNIESMKVYQNAPNPFNETTIIKCYIPKNIYKVELCVYNMQGVQVKCLSISERENVNVQILAEQLAAGVYTYLLIGDGKTSEAKQMILTK